MTRLASHFQNQADDARVARVWRGLERRLPGGGGRSRLLARGAFALAFACASAFALYVGLELRDRARPRADSPQVLELADGSRVEHLARDRIEIAAVSAERIELRMVQGHARFRVAKNPKRAFLTHARGYTIRVIGTEFDVDADANALRVTVARGLVEVLRDRSADVWRVRAGESWSSSSAPSSAPVAAQAAPVEPAQAPPPVVAPSGVSKHGPQHAAQAPALSASDAAAALFQHAQDARVAGNSDETARLLEEFVQRFPGDSRLSLAAFQLGRIRLEQGDARGALEALDQAQKAGDAFKEQVDARRIQALEQAGEVERCRIARDFYLHAFPNGSFAEVVRHRCP